MARHRIEWRSTMWGRIAPRQVASLVTKIVVTSWCVTSAACDAAPGPLTHKIPTTVAITAATTVTGSMIQVDVTAANHGTTSIPYDANTCGAVSFALYRDSSDATPVWKNPGMACLLWAGTRMLAPGDSVAMFAYYAPNMGLDGSTPPAGTYVVKATVGLGGLMRTVDAGTATIGE